jgi:hypothetical protein
MHALQNEIGGKKEHKRESKNKWKKIRRGQKCGKENVRARKE